MKDGTIYKGKIQIETDKAVLIGNPPFDSTAYMLKTQDIEKIIYEEYRPAPPAIRRRGAIALLRLDGQMFSSKQLAVHPAPNLAFEAGFRVHPALELNASIDWAALTAKSGFTIADAQTPPQSRQYKSFQRRRGIMGGRLYPFVQKKWKTEPYLHAGYIDARLTPSGSGDRITGNGWTLGLGAHRPLTTHWFFESRLAYESVRYDEVRFLNQRGTLSPAIRQNAWAWGFGVSYRL